jgi:glycosyltransferase involved in cell wall biosynthesis
MKIAHVAATPDGAPWMVALAREQRKLGHDVSVIIPSRNGTITAILEPLGIPTYAAPLNLLGNGTPWRKALDLLTLVRLFRRLRPDVVHSHIIGSVVTARIASWIADVPAHFGGNAHPISLESDTLRELEIGTAFCDTTTIASCSHTRELFLQHGLPREKVELVYYAVDQDRHAPELADGTRVRKELGLAPDAPVVGKMAYFYPPSTSGRALPPNLRGRGIKGHDVLLRAAPLVLERIPDAKFLLVGKGWGPGGPAYEQQLKDLAESLGLGDAVLFPGERSDVPDVLAAFDVSVHCCLSDNLGGTVESLLMERPMVVSDIGGFKDTVLHEKTGLVVPPDDPRALADAIVRLLQDRELAARLGRQGRAHMLSRFTLARAVADLESLLARTAVRRGYRLRKTFPRALVTPFVLLRLAWRVRRILKSA